MTSDRADETTTPAAQARHTTGPWTWYDAREDDPTADPPYEVYIQHKQSICYVRRADDARLIAAAPNLLDACQAMVDACTNAPPMELIKRFSAVADQCAAAVRKATGADQ